jgi:NAD(P)H-quinone oxidoreductase subunit 4L
MAALSLNDFLVLSAVLFAIGLFGVLTKRNAVVILMCIEIMLNAVNISMAAFSRYIAPGTYTGQVFVIFILVVAAAEAAVGIAIMMNIFRSKKSVEADKIDLMKW